MRTLLDRFLRDQTGATAIEYGLIAAGIAVVIIATVQAIGGNLQGTFTTVSNALTRKGRGALDCHGAREWR